MSTLAGTDYSDVRHRYQEALMARDSHRARSLVEHALGAGAEAAEMDLQVLAPTLQELGDLWERGVITVAHEHYASGVTEGLMALVAASMRRPPAGGRLAVVACPHGERHGLAARMLGDFLEAEGWEVLVVGPDVPVRDLVALVGDEQPDVVAVSVTLPERLEPAVEMLGALSVVEPRPFLVAGGQALGDAALPAALGADAVVADIPSLVGVLRERFPPVPEDPDRA